MEQSPNLGDRGPKAVAQNLRALCEERTFGLSQPSDPTGVSKSMLRQIEIGQSSPTVATLCKIANGLRASLAALMTRQEREVSVQAFKRRAPLHGNGDDRRRGDRLCPLVLFDPQRAPKGYDVEIDPGITLDADPHRGSTQAHVFGLRGEVEAIVDGTLHAVQAEHEIRFPANCPHGYRNSGGEMAVARC